MEQPTWYDTFTDILYKKYPKRKQLMRALMDLLLLEREAVYRRLRKEVPFTIHEVATIASAWSISIDELLSVNTGKITFQMQCMSYIHPQKEEVNFLRFVIQSIQFLKDFPNTEFLDVCNKLPRQLIAGYEQINKFYLFKWMYLNRSEAESLPLSKIILSKEKQKITTEYNHAIKQVPNSNFIFDKRIFQNLVNDIQYFHSIYLITKEEKELIKKEILVFLDYLLEVANKGYYPETKKKVNLYISQLEISTGYSYSSTPDINMCFIHVFDKYEIYSSNSEMVTNFMNWMQLKKRASIQISEVDEKNRIEFFSKQKQIVETL